MELFQPFVNAVREMKKTASGTLETQKLDLNVVMAIPEGYKLNRSNWDTITGKDSKVKIRIESIPTSAPSSPSINRPFHSVNDFQVCKFSTSATSSSKIDNEARVFIQVIVDYQTYLPLSSGKNGIIDTLVEKIIELQQAINIPTTSAEVGASKVWECLDALEIVEEANMFFAPSTISSHKNILKSILSSLGITYTHQQDPALRVPPPPAGTNWSGAIASSSAASLDFGPTELVLSDGYFNTGGTSCIIIED